MKKSFKYPVLLIAAFVLVISGCRQERQSDQAEHKVQLTIQAPEHPASEIKIGTINKFNFADTTLAEAKLDSAGTAHISLDISIPTLAYLSINDKRQEIYLAPGDDMEVHDIESERAMTFAGTGSEVNNYLVHIASVQDKFIQAGGKYIWELEQEAFKARLDSMKNAFADFHRSYTDTVALPEKLSTSLQIKSRIKLVTLKENYELVHYPDRAEKSEVSGEILLEKSKEEYYEVPFDTTLLDDALVGYEYGLALDMYLDLYVSWPVYNSIPEEVRASMQDTIPLMSDQYIRKADFPTRIKEFLIAKNIEEYLGFSGITPAVDTIFNNFKKRYNTSEYKAPLENRYNKWLAIAPGQAAPDVTGTTPEGEKLAFIDLKGKVVYVDVWATWCRPCVEEFPHSKKVQQSFEGNDEVVFLYVSVDQDEEKWKNMLTKDLELKGVHMINQPEAGDASIWEQYLIRGVPRYILIDQAGKIVDANAARPSSGKVESQIHSLLEKNT